MESDTQAEDPPCGLDSKQTADICLCPICQSTVQEAFVTKCGHSFCHSCIQRHLEERKSCPTCSNALTPSEISPNFALNQLLHSRNFEKMSKLARGMASGSDQHHQTSVNDFLRTLNEKSPSLLEIDSLIGGILEMRRKREFDHKEAEEEILMEFLTRVRDQKRQALEKLSSELRFLEEDLDILDQRKSTASAQRDENSEVPNVTVGTKRTRDSFELSSSSVVPNSDILSADPPPPPLNLNSPSGSNSGSIDPQRCAATRGMVNGGGLPPSTSDGGLPIPTSTQTVTGAPPPPSTFYFPLCLSPNSAPANSDSRLVSKRMRVNKHFDDLKNSYFDLKLSIAVAPGRAGLTSLSSGLQGGSSTFLSTNSTSSTGPPPPTPLPPLHRIGHSPAAQSNGISPLLLPLQTSPLGGVVANSAAAVQSGGNDGGRPSPHGGREDALELFGEVLSKFMRFETIRPVTTLKSGDAFSASNVVASIEFDKDQEFFGTAGVTKKIRVFGFDEVLSSTSDGCHYPVCELSSKAKLSCLSWNPYIKNQIVSSDYEGTVALWDVSEAKRVMAFQEHEKRAWSVHFSPTNPTMAVSGSDDATVKVWKTNQKQSAWTINSKANICCVRFNPDNAFHIAFGSADHNIHYYDLRNSKEPLYLFQGHKKAVSCVKFLNSSEFVSASTDNTLKLWNMTDLSCTRTFHGHANERNFVGLSVVDEYFACGSETNTAHIYYKGFHRPALSFKFAQNAEDGEEDAGGNGFVSSVCWKRDSNYLIAANSLGVINVLEVT